MCRNPALAAERARKREALLVATENQLTAVAAAVARRRRPLRGSAKIGLRVGAVLNRRKMAKHFVLSITDTAFTFTRDDATIAREAALDGVYVLRTNVAAAILDTGAVVLSYKALSTVERAFRSLNQDRRTRNPPNPPPPRRPGARPRLSVHARLLPDLAHAPRLGRAVVR